MSRKRPGSLLHKVLVTEGVKRELDKQRASTPQSPPATHSSTSTSTSDQLSPLIEESTSCDVDNSSPTKPLGDKPPSRRLAVTGHQPFPLELPHNHNASARAFYYGYSVTDETMCQYLSPRVGTFIDKSEVDTMHITDATALCLQRETGIRTPLHFKTALVDSTNQHLPRWEDPTPRIPIISVTSNYSLEYDKRPSQEQMEKLTKLLGKEPQWWLDSWATQETS